jgi:hypothetical protein
MPESNTRTAGEDRSALRCAAVQCYQRMNKGQLIFLGN